MRRKRRKKRRSAGLRVQAIPGQWVDEWTSDWIDRCRRVARTYKTLDQTALAFIRLTSIRFMLGRIIGCPETVIT